jgi:hypothetical protein
MVNGDIAVFDGPARDDALARGEVFQHKPPNSARGRMCLAMSQQRADFGNEAAPQKFIRLVGCRDSRRARSAAAVSPALAPRS